MMTDGMGALPGMGFLERGAVWAEGFAAAGQWAVAAVWFPVAMWTVWAGVGLWALRRAGTAPARPLHPGRAYRVGQVLLFTLPVVLLARGWAPDAVRDLSWPAWASLPASGPVAVENRSVRRSDLVRAPVAEPPGSGVGRASAPSISVGPPAPVPSLSASVPDRSPTPAAGAGGASVAAFSGLDVDGARVLAWISALGLLLSAAGGAVGLGVFLMRIRELSRLRTALPPVSDPALRARMEAVARRVGLTRPIDWRVGPAGSVPMTFGARRPVVSLPAGILSDPISVDLALRHELVHVRRHDFAWALAEGLVLALFSFHPLVRTLVRHVGDARERSCDLEVVTHLHTPRRYGELLIQMAGRPKAPLLVAAGLSPSSSDLKERLETMSRFAGCTEARGLNRIGAFTAATGLAVAVLAACAGDVPPDVDSPEASGGVAEAFTSRFGPMSDETREEALARLDIQMSYLVEQMDALEQSARNGDYPRYVSARYELLNGMYVERLEQYETLRMEAEVNRQLGVS